MKRIFQQLMNFALVGVLATLIDYLVFALLFNGLKINYLIATVAAFIVSTVFNYWASMRYVFSSRFEDNEKMREFMIFVTLSISGLVLTALLMKVTVDYLLIHPNIAKILVTGVVMVFNFVTRKLFIEGRD
ncbi:GtrA family protein [Aerococcaceae bacterium DSM 111022]|nr:GtrA family protein [Aerococcaceae bacterium DSM 111022]